MKPVLCVIQRKASCGEVLDRRIQSTAYEVLSYRMLMVRYSELLKDIGLSRDTCHAFSFFDEGETEDSRK
jgi:hypothetical protein